MRLLLLSLLAVLALVSLAAAAMYVLFAFVFWEPDGTKPGSAAYIFAIPSTAKNFPLWEPCHQATYSYRFQDGLSPETYWMGYEARLGVAELKGAFESHAKSLDCTLIDQPKGHGTSSAADPIIACRTGPLEIRLTSSSTTEAARTCHLVTIFFVSDLY